MRQSPPEEGPIDGANEPQLVMREPGCCILLDRGALVAIQRATLDARGLAAFSALVKEVARSHPRGLVLLTAFRLDPRFRLDFGIEREIPTYIDALRTVDRHIAAIASVLEFGGVRSAFMRATATTVHVLARPRASLAMFDNLIDAAEWIAPRASVVGAPGDLASYVRAYRRVDRELRVLDAS
jgi:hypothetical protein